MKRFDCLKVFASMMPADDLVVTSLGNTVFEWRTVRPSLANFYNVNLGQCTPVALGLALALPHRTVMALDGDGNLVSLIVFLLICPPSAQSKSKNPEVTISYRGVGIAHDLLKIIGANRIFEKHGVNATSIYIGSESLMNQAVVGGSIQFTTSDLPPQSSRRLAGIDFKIISGTINRLDGALMYRKGIRTPQELKGKKLAISRFGSVSDTVTRMVSAIGVRTD